MSTWNNDTLPKVWLTVKIVHYILLLSGTAFTIALARTCKVLYSSIVSCNSFWHKLYQENFPRDINTDIDWVQWQLEQEQSASEAVNESENEDVPRITWFQRYNQRIRIGSNWQKNRPTSTVNLDPFVPFKIFGLRDPCAAIIAKYPGWIAMAYIRALQVDLIKLSLKNTAEVYSIDLDKTIFTTIKNIKFYRYREQAGDVAENMRLILHLKCCKESLEVLQLWNANSREMLRSINIHDDWDGRIIGASLLLCKYYFIRSGQLLYSSFSTIRLREPQILKKPNNSNRHRFGIHTVSNNEMIFLHYFDDSDTVSYRIIRVLLTSGGNLLLDNDGVIQMATILSGDWNSFSETVNLCPRLYSIDYDRILFYCNAATCKNALIRSRRSWRRYIKVISLSEGVIFECDFRAKDSDRFILIPEHNVIVFYSDAHSPIVIISLLDGKIKHKIHVNILFAPFYHLQHLIDKKIVCCNYNIQQYCIIDVVTGEILIYPFPLPIVRHCIFAYGHMLLLNKETTLIKSFAPDLL
ncbi:hypothetical protein BDF19DRAFT_414212 [Syncephalis fuscata]|nr:hypothetical protein BDF19DRAFT_414212 [Syncephalis fuscata]